jgi:N-methylhydantoinase B/oxoprolinase/acetone carboxylase alpha subunit
MREYLVFRVPTEAPRPTSGEVANPQVGPIFWRPARLSSSFYSAADGGPLGGAGAEGPEASTINVKTSTVGPLEVLELKVRERPPST